MVFELRPFFEQLQQFVPRKFISSFVTMSYQEVNNVLKFAQKLYRQGFLRLAFSISRMTHESSVENNERRRPF